MAQKAAPTKDTAPPEDISTEGQPLSRWQRFVGFIRTHRTRVIIAVGVLIIAPVAVWAYVQYTKPVQIISPKTTPKKHAKPTPTTKPAPLTGLEVSPEVAAKPVIGVVIENHPDARPQSGLGSAGIVYEALAEGGITRFLAFYQTSDLPEKIGPVRSIRTYFVDWGLEFNAPIAHAGGNADALDEIQPLGLKDINALSSGAQYFYRTRDRYAPHNLYTSATALTKALTAYGYTQPPSFNLNARKQDEPTDTPAHGDININYSYRGYQVEYTYQKDCNCYNRFLSGAPHIDTNTNKQIQVKNVVVQYMPTSYGKTRIGEDTVIMGTPGAGKAIVFRDGGAVEGTWTKSAHTQRTQLLDANGKEIPLDKGNTWYSIVPTTKTVSY